MKQMVKRNLGVEFHHFFLPENSQYSIFRNYFILFYPFEKIFHDINKLLYFIFDKTFGLNEIFLFGALYASPMLRSMITSSWSEGMLKV